MTEQITHCKKCILPSNFQYIDFDEQGVCSYCKKYQPVQTKPEAELLKILEKAKKKHKVYDALVPLSGGKDSTYALYLATRKYDLNVLAFIYDNGFMSEIALENIENATRQLGVDHVFYRPSWDLLKRLYRQVLLKSGELCTVCGIGINNSILKISEAWDIPLILKGSMFTETNTIYFEQIYDVDRFKHILSEDGLFSESELENYLIYPDLDLYKQKINSLLGKFGKSVNILFYQSVQNENTIAEILQKELLWQDGGKHSDCVAEQFSNYIRENRYGYSRSVAHLSNLVRSNQISRDEALQILIDEAPAKKQEKVEKIVERLGLSPEELNTIININPKKYEEYTFQRNRVFDKIIRTLDNMF